MATSKNSIIRLSQYRNALVRMQTLGFVRVFSDNIAEAVGSTAAQVRKDFSIFAIVGRRRGGYIITELVEKLNTILGKDEVQEVILAGLGNLGQALVTYRGFEKEGLKIVACFDINPNKYRADGALPVMPLDNLKNFVKDRKVKIGIIAVPDIAAQQVADIMISAGIKGILNFAPIRLRHNEDCVINNIDVALELENVIYFVKASQAASNNR